MRTGERIVASATFYPHSFFFFFHLSGQRFALMEEKVVLSSILRKFNVEACQDREDLRPVGELILRPEKGIEIKLEKRVSHS